MRHGFWLTIMWVYFGFAATCGFCEDYLNLWGDSAFVDATNVTHEALKGPAEDGAAFLAPEPPPMPMDESSLREYYPCSSALWVEGYWTWWPERRQFVWMQGCFRQPPPGLVWYAGRWIEMDGAWLWRPGYWGPNHPHRLMRSPVAPPARKNEQPPGASRPGMEWIPGTWRWDGNQFVWVSGAWRDVPQQHMVWVSGCWVNAGDYYVYLPGRWDYARTARIHHIGSRPGSMIFQTGRQRVPRVHSTNVVGHRMKPPTIANPPAKLCEDSLPRTCPDRRGHLVAAPARPGVRIVASPPHRPIPRGPAPHRHPRPGPGIEQGRVLRPGEAPPPIRGGVVKPGVKR